MKEHHYNPDSCTTCTTCGAYCPVTAATRKFRGPKLTGPAAARFRLSENDVDESLEYCSNCKNCEISCPSGVPISTLNMLAKAEYYETHPHLLRDWILSHGEKLAQIAILTPALANMGMNNPISRALMKQIGIAEKPPLPAYAVKPFSKLFKTLRQKPSDRKVVFFPGCFVNYNAPEVGLDLVEVMQANNIEVIVPAKLVCCGSPLVVNGYLKEASANAGKNITILREYVHQGFPIITCCTSCSLMLKQESQELFDVEGLEEVAASTYDVFEYLSELYDNGKLNTNFRPIQQRYLYHAPCHLRAQGIGRPSLEILSLIPELEVVEADAGCCGISGNYGFKDDKYDVAMAVGHNLFDFIKASGAETVLSDCGTCRLQITHGTGVKTAHPISIVRNAYDIK